MQRGFGLIRVAALFDVERFPSHPQRPAPYARFLPHVLASFDASNGFACEIRQDASSIAPQTRHRDLLITLDNECSTTWFALEIQLPWTDVRPAKSISTTLFATASSKCNVDMEVFYYDASGSRRKLLRHATNDKIEADAKYARLDAHLELPDGVPVDFQREPELAVFFTPDVATIRIADWSIGFE